MKPELGKARLIGCGPEAPVSRGASRTLNVAAGVSPGVSLAVEPGVLARRACDEIPRKTPVSQPDPGGGDAALYGRRDACRYSYRRSIT